VSSPDLPSSQDRRIEEAFGQPVRLHADIEFAERAIGFHHSQL